MEQIGRSATLDKWGYLHPCRYVLTRSRPEVLRFVPVGTGNGRRENALPAKGPNLNAFAELWVRSVKQECLSKLILFGEGPLSRALSEDGRHYHHERNHRGKDNKLLSQNETRRADRLSVTSDSAACSNTIGAPHEYFDQTGNIDTEQAVPSCDVAGVLDPDVVI